MDRTKQIEVKEEASADEFFWNPEKQIRVHKASVTLTFDALLQALENRQDRIDYLIMDAISKDVSPTEIFKELIAEAKTATLMIYAEEAAAFGATSTDPDHEGLE